LQRPVHAVQSTALRVFSFLAAFGLAVAIWLNMMPAAGGARIGPAPVPDASAARLDPSRFILNALLVPALDADSVPLRWVDPRRPALCGPYTAVWVNGKPLRPGELVPDTPFELEWRADRCHPLGAHGPRFDGRVKLTVFREDWGFSAMVESSGLRAMSAENGTIPIRSGTASMPQCIEPSARTAISLDRPLQC
jgi:hypothetical protein